MQALEKRVAALEQAAPPDDDGVLIFIVAIEPGNLSPEMTHVSGANGQVWTREPDESEQDFRDRVKREVVRNKGGAAMVFTNLTD